MLKRVTPLKSLSSFPYGKYSCLQRIIQDLHEVILFCGCQSVVGCPQTRTTEHPTCLKRKFTPNFQCWENDRKCMRNNEIGRLKKGQVNGNKTKRHKNEGQWSHLQN